MPYQGDLKFRQFRRVRGKWPETAVGCWRNMIARCHDNTHPSYPNYGARGITVAEPWHHFQNFYKDMGSPPKGLSLDRIDNDKGYSKDNCRWATPKEQSNNRSTNVVLTYKGYSKTVKMWADELDVDVRKLYKWIKQGHTDAEILGYGVLTIKAQVEREQGELEFEGFF